MGATLWTPQQQLAYDAQNTVASERIVAIAAQQVLTLTSFAYILGAKSVLVFKNGAILAPTVDYTELSTTSLRLTQAAALNDLFVVVGFIRVYDATATVQGIYNDLAAIYLGASATAPTLNDIGNPLTAGALYYNTTTSGLFVYSGTSWQTAGIPISGTLLAANNLSDVASLSTARANLGVRAYTVNVVLANDLDKKVQVANTAALVGARILACIVAVQGDTLNDEMEFTSVEVAGNVTTNNSVNLFLHCTNGFATGTFVVCYIIQN